MTKLKLAFLITSFIAVTNLTSAQVGTVLKYHCKISLTQKDKTTFSDINKLSIKNVEVIHDGKFKLHKIPNSNSAIVTKLTSMDDLPLWAGYSDFIAYFVKNTDSLLINGVLEPSMAASGLSDAFIATTIITGQERLQPQTQIIDGNISTLLNAYCELK